MQPNNPNDPNFQPQVFVGGANGVGVVPPPQAQAPVPQVGGVSESFSYNSAQISKIRSPKRLIVSLVALLVVAGLSSGGYFGYKQMQSMQAKAAARTFISVLNSGDNVHAYALAGEPLQAQTTAADFTQSMGDLTAQAPIYLTETVKVKGSTAVYSAQEDGLTSTAAGRTDGAFSLSLAKTGFASWKVVGVSVQ